jgi:hypothetical protein
MALSCDGNNNRWVFYGTRKQIIDWIIKHQELMIVANTEEVVIDMLHAHDLQVHYSDFFKTYFDLQRVKVEIRPHIPSKDELIPYVRRVIISSGTKLANIVDILKDEWHRPVRHPQQHHVFPLSTATT